MKKDNDMVMIKLPCGSARDSCWLNKRCKSMDGRSGICFNYSDKDIWGELPELKGVL